VLAIQIPTLLLLLLILVQDIVSRAVYWILFPLLGLSFILLRLAAHQPGPAIVRSSAINLAFLALQLLLVSLYFSARHKSWVNITRQLLGWGDILFLACIACYLSALNFLLFYMVSLIGALLGWLFWQLLVTPKSKQIPLAGLQSLLLVLFLATDWWLLPVNLTTDNWLVQLWIK
jgi:hypothetical protein